MFPPSSLDSLPNVQPTRFAVSALFRPRCVRRRRSSSPSSRPLAVPAARVLGVPVWDGRGGVVLCTVEALPCQSDRIVAERRRSGLSDRTRPRPNLCGVRPGSCAVGQQGEALPTWVGLRWGPFGDGQVAFQPFGGSNVGLVPAAAHRCSNWSRCLSGSARISSGEAVTNHSPIAAAASAVVAITGFGDLREGSPSSRPPIGLGVVEGAVFEAALGGQCLAKIQADAVRGPGCGEAGCRQHRCLGSSGKVESRERRACGLSGVCVCARRQDLDGHHGVSAVRVPLRSRSAITAGRTSIWWRSVSATHRTSPSFHCTASGSVMVTSNSSASS